MSKQEKVIEETCPNCKHTGHFEELSRRVYSPPLTSQRTISKILRCPNCLETIAKIIRSEANWDCFDGY